MGNAVPVGNKFSMELLSVKQLQIPELYLELTKDLSDRTLSIGERAASQKRVW